MCSVLFKLASLTFLNSNLLLLWQILLRFALEILLVFLSLMLLVLLRKVSLANTLLMIKGLANTLPNRRQLVNALRGILGVLQVPQALKMQGILQEL